MEIASIQRINQLNQMTGVDDGNVTNLTQEKTDMFESFLNSIDTMKKTQETSKLEMSEVLMGNSDNAHNALILLEKANLQMQFATAVRDKVVQGVNQILNMQV